MPIHKVPGGWKWGKSGKVYKNKEDAERQMRAIYASGYKEEAFPTFREFVESCRKLEEADRDGEYEEFYHNKPEKPDLERLFGKKAVEKSTNNKPAPLTPEQKRIQNQINYRTRKLLGYLPPYKRREYEQQIKDLKALL